MSWRRTGLALGGLEGSWSKYLHYLREISFHSSWLEEAERRGRRKRILDRTRFAPPATGLGSTADAPKLRGLYRAGAHAFFAP